MDTEKIFVCENCGFPNEMIYHNCKIVCQHCGFMLDCSDLDVGNEIKQASLRQSRAKSNPPSYVVLVCLLPTVALICRDISLSRVSRSYAPFCRIRCTCPLRN